MKGIEQKVLRFINQYKLINSGDRILVAFSGGPDSVFALSFLNAFRLKYKIMITAIHFNHGLRGKESDEDERFAKEFCKKLGIRFTAVKLNVRVYAKKNKLSIEEAARILRYKNLSPAVKDFRCNKIVTAHNQSDNTETILINLFTGTGFSGLTGIPIIRDNIIRPLMCLSKNEILEYLISNNIPYRVDSSNLSDDYKRNFLRNRILPELKNKLNPQLDDALFRTSKNFESALYLIQTLVNHIIAEYITHNSGSVNIPLLLTDMFEGEIPGEILRVIFKKYLKIEFEYDDYLRINSLVEKQKGKLVQLREEFIAVREEDSIRVEKKIKSQDQKLELKAGNIVTLNGLTLGIEQTGIEDVKFGGSKGIEYISSDEIRGKFVLRKWEDGDKFQPLGMKQFKTVSDFLTDCKISSVKKKEQLVLTNRNHIVWVVGLRLDERYKVNSKTKKILKLWMK
jgi:tRNA(Ile)-lysidine synthase